MSDYTTTGDGSDRGAAAPRRGEAPRQAGLGGLPLLRAAAADPEERALQVGQAAAERPVVTAIDERRQRLGEPGRLVIRPSGTEPVIRVMGEGDDRDLVTKVVDDVVDALSRRRRVGEFALRRA